MKQFWVLGLLLTLLLITPAMGAVLQGTVYDFSLQKADNVIIEINTEPQQRTVTQKGNYQFNLEPGEYELVAKDLQSGVVTAQTSEKVSITNEGVFTIDLILFPEITEEEINLPTIEEEEPELYEKSDDPFFFVYRIGWVILILFVLWSINKAAKNYANKTLEEAQKEKKNKKAKRKKQIKKITKKVKEVTPLPKKEEPEMPDDLVDIISIIKKHGSRMTQKDLRKQLPHSEAKISLMLLELEKEGKIKKIKKGRGNVIILK